MTKFLATALVKSIAIAAVAAMSLASCATYRALDDGLLPGEVHAGPPVEFVDAPLGTVIEASDGTTLSLTRGGWVLSTSAGTVPAVNAYWFDDPRPELNNTRPVAPQSARVQLAQQFGTFTPGDSARLQESSTNALSGVTAVLTVLGGEHVSVPAGDFDVVHLRRYDNSNCGGCSPPLRIVQDIWFAPGVGVVKYKTNQISGYQGAGFEWQAVVIRHS